MRALAAVACLASASCSYGVTFKDCEVSCAADRACPDGFACNSEGQCRIAGAVGSCPAPADGGVDSDGGNTMPVPGIYVADFDGNQILVFAANATGSATPVRTISGSNTMLNTPEAIAIDHAGEIVVANLGTADSVVGVVTVYPGDADGDVAPTRVLTVTSGQFGVTPLPVAVAIASDDGVFVAATVGTTPQISHFPPGAGSADRSFTANASNGDPFLAIAPTGEIVVTYEQEVDTFAAAADGSAAPLRTFTRPIAGTEPAVVVTDGAIAITEDTGQLQLFETVATGSATAASTLAPAQIVHPASGESLAVDASGTSPVFYLLDDQQPEIFVVPTTGSGDLLAAGTVTTIATPGSDALVGIAVVP